MVPYNFESYCLGMLLCWHVTVLACYYLELLQFRHVVVSGCYCLGMPLLRHVTVIVTNLACWSALLLLPVTVMSCHCYDLFLHYWRPFRYHKRYTTCEHFYCS